MLALHQTRRPLAGPATKRSRRSKLTQRCDGSRTTARFVYSCSANSAKRSDEELVTGVAEWVEKKFRRSDKRTLMSKLWQGEWSSELVVNVVKSDHELSLIAGHGIKIHALSDIVSSLANERFIIGSASGADIVDLIHIGSAS